MILQQHETQRFYQIWSYNALYAFSTLAIASRVAPSGRCNAF